MVSYKIVEIKEGSFVIYTKKLFFWKPLKYAETGVFKTSLVPILFNSYESAIVRVKTLANSAKAKKEKKSKFKPTTTYFNIYGDQYDPQYQNADPAKNKSCNPFKP